MFKYRIILLKNKDQQHGEYGEAIDITAISHSFSLASSKTNYARNLSFSVLQGNTINQLALEYIPINPVELGDIIQLFISDDVEEQEVFRGIISKKNGEISNANISYEAFDFGFYINKNEDSFKFFKQSAKECISKMFSEFSFNLTINEAPTDVIINKLYAGKNLGEIIKGITEEIKLYQGRDFYLDVQKNEFEYKQTKRSKFENDDLSDFVTYDMNFYQENGKYDFKSILGRVSFEDGIEELRNVIKVVVETEKKLSKKSSSSKSKTSGQKGVSASEKKKKNNNKKVTKEQKKEIVDLKYKDKATNRSIEDEKKEIERLSNTNIQSKFILRDDISIEKYGVLQKVEHVKADDITGAKEFAENVLSELNKIQTKTEITLYNCPYLEPYDLLEFIEPKLDLMGVYEIQSIKFQYNNLNIEATIVLERIREYKEGE
jgi:hypothetical protein